MVPTSVINPFATAINLCLTARLQLDLAKVQVLTAEYAEAWGRGDVQKTNETMIEIFSLDKSLSADNIYKTPVAGEA